MRWLVWAALGGDALLLGWVIFMDLYYGQLVNNLTVSNSQLWHELRQLKQRTEPPRERNPYY